MPGSSSDGPEDIRLISGVLVVSRQPERLMEFYRDVLGLPQAEERHGDTEPHWGCELGDVHFAAAADNTLRAPIPAGDKAGVSESVSKGTSWYLCLMLRSRR